MSELLVHCKCMLWRNVLECYGSFKRQIREVDYLNEIINTIENTWEIILSTCLPPRPDELQLKSRKKPLEKRWIHHNEQNCQTCGYRRYMS